MVSIRSVLSIQSSVAYGHVGNSAAVFPLQRLGIEVWPVHTVHFSNHTAYETWRGPLMSAADLREVVTGVSERGILDTVDVVLSGYLGATEVADVVLETVALVRAANPTAIYACDPVMGNVAFGCFVEPPVRELLCERVSPTADLLTPNQFELGLLTGTEPASLDETLVAVDRVRAGGPTTVLVTSVLRPDRPADTIEMLAVDDTGAHLVRTPHLPVKLPGSGDVTAALFTAHLLTTGDIAEALGRTGSTVFDIMERTFTAGSSELLLVQSQDEIAHPKMQFEVTRVR